MGWFATMRVAWRVLTVIIRTGGTKECRAHSSYRAAKGLLHYKDYRVENNLLLTRRQEDNENTFGLYQYWKLRIGQLLPRYDSSAPF